MDILQPVAKLFFQGASSLRRSEVGPRSNRLWTLFAPGAGKGLFRRASSPYAEKIIPCKFLN